ncbi:MAG: hypothetical protein Q4D13_01395 [Erysipelotrichaceae bacterium]|nr:hypothetical protein [Erysipelotrichaceae bacterium]
MLKGLKKILYFLCVVWVAFLYFTMKPAINIHSFVFWLFFVLSAVPFLLLSYDFKEGVFT